MNFEPGATVSAPITGLCKVVGVKIQEILGEEHRMLVLEPFDEELGLLTIPENRWGQMGLRNLVEPDKAEKVLEASVEVEPPKTKPHQRIKAWTKALRSGEFGVRKRVLLEFESLKKENAKISRDETRFMDKIKTNLRRELELSLDINPSQAGRKLSAALS